MQIISFLFCDHFLVLLYFLIKTYIHLHGIFTHTWIVLQFSDKQRCEYLYSQLFLVFKATKTLLELTNLPIAWIIVIMLIPISPAVEHCNFISSFSNQCFVVYSDHRNSTLAYFFHNFYHPHQTGTARDRACMYKNLIRPRNSTILLSRLNWHCESLALFFRTHT